jgi:hypothetical protein
MTIEQRISFEVDAAKHYEKLRHPYCKSCVSKMASSGYNPHNTESILLEFDSIMEKSGKDTN